MSTKNFCVNIKRLNIILILLVSLTLLSACQKFVNSCDSSLSSTPKFQFNEILNLKDLQIKLDYSNKGDSYKLIIHGNNTFDYTRISPINQERHGKLNDDAIPKLILEFENNKFNYMRDSYFCSDATDRGYSKITIAFNDKVISADSYGRYGPTEFYKLKDSIIEVLNDKCEEIEDEYLKNECYKVIIDGHELASSEGKTIDTSILKKQAYEKVIRDNPEFCYGKKSYGNCTCQNNYVKTVFQDNFFCIPSLCVNVFGVTPIGEPQEDILLMPNYDYCEWAVRDSRSDVCDIISYQQGKDICILAYVGESGNKKECEKIFDQHLKNECYT